MSISHNFTNLQLDTYKHSFAHLMAAAVGQMFPEAQYGVGPVINNGCYYDFVLPRNLVPEDLPILEGHIKEMLKSHLSFKSQEYSLEDAIAHFSNANQPLKVELLENLRDRGTTSMSDEEKADFVQIPTLSKPNITYRRAVREDLEGIFRVHRVSMLEAFVGERYGLTEKLILEFLEDRADEYNKYFEKTKYFVASSGGVIIGVIGAPTDRAIKTLFVDPEYQRQGIATNLLKLVLKEYGDSENVSVKIGLQKNGGVINLYQKLGFEPTGLQSGLKLFDEQTRDFEMIEYVITKDKISEILEAQKADFESGTNQDLDLLLSQAKLENKRVICDAIIFNSDNQVFVQKRSANRLKHPNCWDLVGGHLDEGESLEQCIKREVWEEIGCEVDSIKLIDTADSICDASMLKEGEIAQERVFRFLVKLKTFDIVLEQDKTTEYRWLDESQIDITLENRTEKNGITYIRDSLSSGFEFIRRSNVPKITLYRIVNEKTGEIIFEDLCKGPHIDHIKEIKNIGFKLDKFSASYWCGDQARGVNMQRLYALIFLTKDELKAFTDLREEAKKRDHRVLGGSLKLFTISDLVGSGLPLLQPRGAIIRKLLEDYLWQLQKHTHQRVYTPHITKEALYEKSGHAGKYLDDMFSVYGGTSKERFYLKPMNCPMHMQIFDDNQFSYKDMPVRYFDPTTVYRDEKTGQLSGLTRVRSITQDDGHIFCRVPQIEEEFTAIVKTIREFYGSLGMEPDWVSWSVRDSSNPDKYLGDPANWDIAEEAIRQAAQVNNLTYKRCEGEAAFYGPKLDFMFKDCLGREWQLSTIQCDFVQPERFDLSFKNEEGHNERPVVIHRAISGSLERFMGILIEHFAGKFPFWLAPEQIRILTINDEVLPFVHKVEEILREVVLMKPLKYNEIRYVVDQRSESLGKKIREAKLDKIPMLFVIGLKDVEAGEVSVEYNGESVKVNLAELKGFLEGV